ncbi:hypothetical protein GE21DRAFT_5265 [Neurospora crassa]|uniref:Uncharacterized protein n=1 Tax=Neurospora crassa (strain ATCC 24698 / 74-OR23-1A / CBS 708.71 / DSM 1257 / FGSC 987) TaxID=367110 RepID=Q7SAZ7_NEUCR|nr:hypothetical protein NCU07628 [Neurospora crassa OR74A]EAA33567.3 hypothetical protein NCU07628 [Neurospora crassa OR74A]KHE84226.1 hypothetical protein GE21DRAFT_5265 [Neurospora crassa]|eukprot:XP_962803.3 hypothetical protein NCU07628 [Neurospora crassa OR74A]
MKYHFLGGMMSPVSTAVSIVATGANAQTTTTAAAVATTMTTMFTSTLGTIIQQQTVPSPTTILPPASKTAPEAAPGGATSPRPFLSEPYASAITLFAAITTIIYFFFYLIPFDIMGICQFSRRVKKRQRKLAEKREKREAKREQVVERRRKDVQITETHAYRVHQILDSERQTNAQILTWEESKRMRETMEKMANTMETVVRAVKGLEGVFQVGLEAVEDRTRALDHKVDWMLDDYLAENDRFHALKSSWGGDIVESRIIVEEFNWEEKQQPW